LDIYQQCKTPQEYDEAFAKLQESLKESISATTLEYRKLLLENTDQSVTELFKKTAMEAERVISEFDEDVLRLCLIALGEKMRRTDDEAVFKIDGYEFPIAFRELKPEEDGKISRAHTEHPIIQRIIADARAVKTAPIPSVAFLLSRHNKKISQLECAAGGEGFLFLWKLNVSGVETEDTVVPMAFVKESNSYKPIDPATSSGLLTVTAEETDKTFASSPLAKEELFAVWENWKKPVLEKYYKRNERLLDRETDRINRYYDDYALRVEDKIKQLEEEKMEANRRRDNSADMEERRKFARRLQDISVAMGKLRLEQVKLKQTAESKRQKEIEELNQKLEPSVTEELIAATHFEIR
jgi:hypothetical protein